MTAVDNALSAIAVMTVWAGDGATSDRPKTMAHLRSLESAELSRLMMGLISLCGDLLVARAIEQGRTIPDQLQDMARTMVTREASTEPGT